jgi:hypothetical protein
MCAISPVSTSFTNPKIPKRYASVELYQNDIYDLIANGFTIPLVLKSALSTISPVVDEIYRVRICCCM